MRFLSVCNGAGVYPVVCFVVHHSPKRVLVSTSSMALGF